MKKSSNLWRIIWVIGIYAILALILYLVVLYKVQWEHKDLNTYLYLYDCNQNLCTSTIQQDNYYNKILCEDDNCPYITSVIDNIVILKNNSKSWIYDYISGKNINDTYNDYRYLRDDMFIFTDSYNKQGVLNLTDGILVQSEYDYIDDYKYDLISYKKDGLFGIDSLNDKKDVETLYQDIVLINDELFAGMKDNSYYIYSFDNVVDNDENKYNYVYSYDDIIFTFSNNKIDILNVKLDSLLLMKINTFYGYMTEKERGSLNFYFDGENLSFNVFTDENEYTEYKFNLREKKLV